MKLRKLFALNGWSVRLCVLMLVQLGGGQAFAQDPPPAEGTPSAETGTQPATTAAHTEGGTGAAEEDAAAEEPPPPVGELEDDNALDDVLDPPRPTPYRFNLDLADELKIWACDDGITQRPDAGREAVPGRRAQFKVVSRTSSYVQIQFFEFTGASAGLNSHWVGTEEDPKRWCVLATDVHEHVVEARVQGLQVGYGALVIPVRVRPRWGSETRRRQVDTDLNIAGSASLFGEVGRNARVTLGVLGLFGLSAIEFEHLYPGDAEETDVTRVAWTVGAGVFTRQGPVTISFLAGWDFLVLRNSTVTDSWNHNKKTWFGISIGLSGDSALAEQGN